MNFPPERRPGVPRLGVGHLLLWTAGCAIVLAQYRGLENSNLWRDPVVESILRVCYSMIYGLALAAVGLFGWWKIRGKIVWRLEPGHWLLLESGLGAFFYLLFRQAESLLFPIPPTSVEAMQPLIVAMCLANIVDLLVACLILVIQRCERRWRLCFVTIVVQRAVSCLAFIPTLSMAFSNSGFPSVSMGWYNLREFVQMLALASIVLLVILAALIDIRRGCRRDWLHWTGVAVRLIIPALHVIMYAARYWR